MVVAPVVLVLELIIIMSCHVDLASDDRLDLRKFLRDLQEFLHSVHISMVGDGQCGHAELLGPLEKAADGCLTVKDGILSVDVKVDK